MIPIEFRPAFYDLTNDSIPKSMEVPFTSYTLNSPYLQRKSAQKRQLEGRERGTRRRGRGRGSRGGRNIGRDIFDRNDSDFTLKISQVPAPNFEIVEDIADDGEFVNTETIQEGNQYDDSIWT